MLCKTEERALKPGLSADVLEVGYGLVVVHTGEMRGFLCVCAGRNHSCDNGVSADGYSIRSARVLGTVVTAVSYSCIASGK